MLPLFGIPLPALLAGVLALGMNFGAYGAEVFRAGILAVPKGQWEGALALNFSKRKRMQRIIIPQIYPIILPPASNLAVELLKGTALVSLITLVDLMFVAKQINMMTWFSAQSFGLALIIYFTMINPISFLINLIGILVNSKNLNNQWKLPKIFNKPIMLFDIEII